MSVELGTANIDIVATIVDVKEAGTNPRLRILELPMKHVGEYSDTPFVFVLDRAEELTGSLPEDFSEAVKTVGAAGTLVFGAEIDLE